MEHGPGQRAREGVLLAWMIRGEEPEACGEMNFESVRERRAGPGNRYAAISENPECRVEPSLAEADNDAHIVEKVEFQMEIGSAVVEFFGRRCVCRRRAATGCRDETAAKRQSIVTLRGSRHVGKPEPMEGLIKPVAASVAGKHASRAICSVCCRSQAYEEKPCMVVAEPGDGSSPILLILKPSYLLPGDVLAPLHKPRTLAARNDVVVQPCPGGTTG